MLLKCQIQKYQTVVLLKEVLSFSIKFLRFTLYEEKHLGFFISMNYFFTSHALSTIRLLLEHWLIYFIMNLENKIPRTIKFSSIFWAWLEIPMYSRCDKLTNAIQPIISEFKFKSVWLRIDLLGHVIRLGL